MKPIALFRAPSNLGLRPLRPGHEPGAWRAPAALCEAGLVERLRPVSIHDLARLVYSPEPQSGTRLLNGHAVRAFNLLLAEAVEDAVRGDRFPLVIGGDCSILLGALAGLRRSGPLSLVHLDGHSDFRHPGNYHPAVTLGAVAGMDLALATGRGEALLTQWPGVHGPLVADAHVCQVGERESRDNDWAWPDILQTDISCVDVFEARRLGAAGVLARIDAVLERRPATPFWLHFDVDVLDQTIMPAVDSPGSPGIDPPDFEEILTTLIQHPWCAGLTVTVFDPDLDPDGRLAGVLVELLAACFG